MLLKMQIPVPGAADSVGEGRGPGSGILNKHPKWSDASGPRTRPGASFKWLLRPPSASTVSPTHSARARGCPMSLLTATPTPPSPPDPPCQPPSAPTSLNSPPTFSSQPPCLALQGPRHPWPHPPRLHRFTLTSDPGPAPTRPRPCLNPAPGRAQTPPLPSPRRASRGGFSISFFRTRGKEPGRPLSPAARPGPGPGPACGSTGGFFPPPASDIVPRALLARLASPARPLRWAGAVRPAAAADTGSYCAGAQRHPRLPPSLPRLQTGSGILIIHRARPASLDRGLGLAHPVRGAGAALRAVIG